MKNQSFSTEKTLCFKNLTIIGLWKMSAPQRLVTRAHRGSARTVASHRFVHHRGVGAAEPGSYRTHRGKNRRTSRHHLYRPTLRQTPLWRKRTEAHHRLNGPQPAAPRPQPAPEEAGSACGGGWRRWVRGGGAAVRGGRRRGAQLVPGGGFWPSPP